MSHTNVFFSRQAPHGFSQDQCLHGLRGLLDRLSTVHVYHWTIGAYEKNLFDESQRVLKYPEDFHRHPLADGVERWQSYLDLAATSGGTHCALLEFVRNDSVEQAQADARELVDLCAMTSSQSKLALQLQKMREQ